ncbi:hypothetical protein CC78DRAFT_620243 [Lojkania enalia]|uniref:Uncharacterized protein n=1 Tax=Lojkania enalia TaxID=147567 RepID=A0A9P4K3X1_9PLEO|nr:hypothetical protein CC78DRAFT_620243 [Didymosphaeria enalia]
MGNSHDSSSSLKSQQTTLLLFTLFGILVVLFLILVTLVFQTWALWKMARTVVEQNTPSDYDGGVGTGGGDGGKRGSMGLRLGTREGEFKEGEASGSRCGQKDHDYVMASRRCYSEKRDMILSDGSVIKAK